MPRVKQPIKTHTTETFRGKYIAPGPDAGAMLKVDYGKFFVVKVQELLRMIALPVPPTRSTTHTLIYLTHGEAIMDIGSARYTIHKNECLIVPAGQVYSFASRDVNRGFLCNFHDSIIVGKMGKKDLLREFDFLNVWGNPRIRLDEQTSRHVHMLFKRLLDAYTLQGIENLLLIQAYLIALLCKINTTYKPLSANGQTTAVALANRFKELLFTNIRTLNRVTDYAALLHISPNHLNKTIKSITGKSTTHWIDETLVLEAKVLLYQTDFSISAVAAEIGIQDSSYFSRLFKKHEGMTPLAFRRAVVSVNREGCL